ncbi:MAG: hypothetical protein AUK48_09255 [Oscillatoriales cyanobacterium CG2_30_44_21]|nr:MAG: hypothetical protein AUK48_09255 [Oscillatoriales cyanobacterium CG2_30_44_21]
MNRGEAAIHKNLSLLLNAAIWQLLIIRIYAKMTQNPHRIVRAVHELPLQQRTKNDYKSVASQRFYNHSWLGFKRKAL